MFDIAGKTFYFDLNEISNIMKVEPDKIDNIDNIDIDKLLTKKEKDDELEEINPDNYPMIDVTKWELTKALIETVLHEQSVIDERMGVAKLGEQLSIPFRLSFNTLLMNKIIKQK